METIETSWIERWQASTGLRLRPNGLLKLGYDQPVGPSVTIATEMRASADLVLLANRLLWPSSDEEEAFPSGVGSPYLLWLREWGVWDDINEAIAAESFRVLLAGYGQSVEAKGLVFQEADRIGAVVFVLHMMLFGWDAYLVPLSGAFLCYLSHDGYVRITAGDEATRGWLVGRLAPWQIAG